LFAARLLNRNEYETAGRNNHHVSLPGALF